MFTIFTWIAQNRLGHFQLGIQALFLVIVIQGCATNKILPIESVDYNDGINEMEAKSLATDYVKKHKKNYCRYVNIYKVINLDKQWKVELVCDTTSGVTLSPYSYGFNRGPPILQRDAGILFIDKKNGDIVRSAGNR